MEKEDLIPKNLYYHDNGCGFILEYLSANHSVRVSRYLIIKPHLELCGPSDNFSDLESIKGFKELTQEQLIIWKTAIGKPIECEPLLYN